MDAFNHFLGQFNPNIVVITEHQKSYDDLILYKLTDFDLISCFCRKKFKSGGVAVYSKSNLISYVTGIEEIQDLSLELHIEVGAIKIEISGLTIIVLGIYRSPVGNIDTFFNRLDYIICKMSTNKPNVRLIILGDINIDTLKDCNDSKQLKDFIMSHNLQDLLGNIPTRVTDFSQTSIDHVVTNMENIFSINVINGHISDHYGQHLVLKLESPKSVPKRFKFKRAFSDRNILIFKQFLKNENWNNVHKIRDVNNKWSSFLDTIKWYLDVSCPVRKCTISDKKALQSDTIVLQADTLKLKYDMINFHELYRKTGNIFWKNEYKVKKKVFRRKVAQEKALNIKKRFENSNCLSKTCWSFANEVRRKKSIKQNISLINEEMLMVCDPTTVAEYFNDEFSAISKACTPVKMCRDQNNLLNFPLLDKCDILHIIDGLNSKKSYGFDEISPYMLKKCKEELCEPLLHLINSVLLEGVFPNFLKLSVIKPLYKKGSRDNVKNYRPVSLTSTFSKLIEKIILLNLIDHYENNNIIKDFQHGFRRGRSTITAAAEFLHTALTKVDEGLRVAGVYLDLSRAFDSVDHGILMQKLARDGINGCLFNLISSYLENRLQCTEIVHDDGLEIKYLRSSVQKVQVGIPQGSILGPFLYIIYVNDFPLSTVSENYFISMYADDTSGLCWGRGLPETEETLNHFIKISTDYFTSNKFLVNVDKTEFMLFGSNETQWNICFPNCNITQTSKPTCKFLGLHIDDKLCWETHIDYVCSKLASGIFLLRRLSCYLDSNSLRMVYFGVFFPFVSYGLILWGSTHEKHIKRVFKLQKKALRIIGKVDVRTSCRPLFLSYEILTIYGLYIYQLILFVKNNSKFTVKNSDVHDYNTRNKDNFVTVKRRLELTSRSPFLMGSKYFNKLPNTIRCLEGNFFKNALKRWLINQCLYSLDLQV